jgi:hypothetical protein
MYRGEDTDSPDPTCGMAMSNARKCVMDAVRGGVGNVARRSDPRPLAAPARSVGKAVMDAEYKSDRCPDVNTPRPVDLAERAVGNPRPLGAPMCGTGKGSFSRELLLRGGRVPVITMAPVPKQLADAEAACGVGRNRAVIKGS